MRPAVFLLVAALVIVAGLPNQVTATEEVPEPSGRVIEATTVLRGETLDMEGNLTVKAGATLRVEGSTLRIGEQLLVEAGASLVLAPWNGVPTRLTPLNETKGFSIQVDGRMESAGLPRSEIVGLNGYILSSVVSDAPGGLRVKGEADLRDIHVHDGTSGISVVLGARMTLQDAAVDRMGFMAVVSEGYVEMRNVTMEGSMVAAAARGINSVLHLDGVRANSTVASFHNVGGRMSVDNSDALAMNSLGVVADGRMPRLWINNTRLAGYTQTGLVLHGNGQIELRDTRFEPAPGAQQGIEAQGPEDRLLLENVVLSDHAADGITGQFTHFDFRGVELARNGEYGIRTAGGTFTGLDTVMFQDNGAAPMSVKQRVAGLVQDNATGNLLPGAVLTILDAEGNTVATSTNLTGTAVAYVETYSAEEGRPVPVEALTFRLEHPLLKEPLTGPLSPTQDYVLAQAYPEPVNPRESMLALWGSIGFVSAGVLLLVYAIVYRHLPWHKNSKRDSQ